MVNGRNKGAQFERMIANELFLMTGVNFSRNLEQYRTKDLGDLIAHDPRFGFLLELKRYAAGTECKAEWKEQASRAAKLTGQIPCVIYKFDRAPIRCAIPMSALCPAMPADQWAEVSLRGLAFLASEKMAEAAR